MGTLLAPNLANLFMTEVETRMLHEYEAKTGLRPMLWLRYIDNIFFLWPYGEESLLEFIDFVRTYSKAKSMKSVLDYEVNYDQEKVSFLDCLIKIRDGQFQTELYTKNTDAHSYLLSSSCHPNIGKSIII